MIACVYGSAVAPFVEPVVRDLAQAARAQRVNLVGVRIRDLQKSTTERPEVSLIYTLPFDGIAEVEVDAAIHSHFPKAGWANSSTAHDLCRDRFAFSERMLTRGIPVPETIVTETSEEALDFVRRHEHVVMRESRSPGSRPSIVLFQDSSGTVVGETRGRRYAVEMTEGGSRCSLAHGVLTVPPPYLLQRMVTSVNRTGVLVPAQTLRAYVVDDEVPFWTEFYNERIQRPSDFLLSRETASTRFVQVVSSEADKLARRVAKVTGMRFGAVDLIRSDTGYVALGGVTDGSSLIIDRSFKDLPEYREAFDLDMHITAAMAATLKE